MSKKERNKELFEKGFLSEEALRELDKELYDLLIEKNKKELKSKKLEFELAFARALESGIRSFF
ncbi:hypothetical protein ACOKFD_15795 [Flagellimonas sp. S174]|uniref:hypothetical protein n=1 Tax=Flagellimonas sp. S174 TaxID=3410790 RepID=UPI003BF4EDE8